MMVDDGNSDHSNPKKPSTRSSWSHCTDSFATSDFSSVNRVPSALSEPLPMPILAMASPIVTTAFTRDVFRPVPHRPVRMVSRVTYSSNGRAAALAGEAGTELAHFATCETRDKLGNAENRNSEDMLRQV